MHMPKWRIKRHELFDVTYYLYIYFTHARNNTNKENVSIENNI